MGRPNIYGPDDFARLEELYHEGLSDQAIEKQTGMSDSVICRWRKSRGLESNYVKRIGMPPPYTRENFQGVYDYNKHLQEWFASEGADTQEKKVAAIIKRAREILDSMQGRNL